MMRARGGVSGRLDPSHRRMDSISTAGGHLLLSTGFLGPPPPMPPGIPPPPKKDSKGIPPPNIGEVGLCGGCWSPLYLTSNSSSMQYQGTSRGPISANHLMLRSELRVRNPVSGGRGVAGSPPTRKGGGRTRKEAQPGRWGFCTVCPARSRSKETRVPLAPPKPSRSQSSLHPRVPVEFHIIGVLTRESPPTPSISGADSRERAGTPPETRPR